MFHAQLQRGSAAETDGPHQRSKHIPWVGICTQAVGLAPEGGAAEHPALLRAAPCRAEAAAPLRGGRGEGRGEEGRGAAARPPRPGQSEDAFPSRDQRQQVRAALGLNASSYGRQIV